MEVTAEAFAGDPYCTSPSTFGVVAWLLAENEACDLRCQRVQGRSKVSIASGRHFVGGHGSGILMDLPKQDVVLRVRVVHERANLGAGGLRRMCVPLLQQPPVSSRQVP